jgi:hypothetical protein
MATSNDPDVNVDKTSGSWRGSPSLAGTEPPAERPTVSRGENPYDLDGAPTLRIRPYSLSDIPAVWRVRGTLRLDIPDSLVRPGSGLLDLPAAMPVLRRNRPMFVATVDGHPVGFARFSPRRPDGRWVLVAIAASTGVYAREPVWEALLAHGVRAAGLRGVRRLFARVPLGHPLIESMRASGWVPYAQETVFRAERLLLSGRATSGVRAQEPADTWAIHQLYAASVPRPVQEVEALTSQVWHMEQPRRNRRGLRQSGCLLEESGQLAAYARSSRGRRADMIDLVVPPGARSTLGALLDGALASNRGRSRAVYCTLRGYQLDLREELTERGFAEIGDQELLIRYTTATARTPALDPVHFPVELRPAIPRRVPTFLEGQPTDGTA